MLHIFDISVVSLLYKDKINDLNMLISKTKHHKHPKLLPDIGFTHSNLVLQCFTLEIANNLDTFVLTNFMYILQADINT